MRQEAWQLVTVRKRKAPDPPRPQGRGLSEGEVMSKSESSASNAGNIPDEGTKDRHE